MTLDPNSPREMTRDELFAELDRFRQAQRDATRIQRDRTRTLVGCIVALVVAALLAAYALAGALADSEGAEGARRAGGAHGAPHAALVIASPRPPRRPSPERARRVDWTGARTAPVRPDGIR